MMTKVINNLLACTFVQFLCVDAQTPWTKSVDFQDGALQKQIVSLFSDVFRALNIQNLYLKTCFSGDAGDLIDGALLLEFADKNFQLFSSLDYLKRSRYYQDGLLLDVECPGVEKFLEQSRLFNPKNFFLVINSTAMKLNSHSVSLNRTSFLEEDELIKAQFTKYLEKVNCLLDCRLMYTVLYYHLPKFHIHYKFYEIYRVKIEQEFHSHLVMFGSNIYRDWKPFSRRHFHGSHLKTATVILEPSISVPSNLETARFLNSDYSTTFHLPLIKALGEGLNFTFDLDILNDYGQFSANGRLSGLVTKLEEGYYDLPATGLVMTHHRIKKVNFLVDTLQMRTAIIFQQPRLVSVSNIYFVTFSLQVWLCIAAVLILGSITLHVQVSVLRRINVEKSSHHETFADRVTFIWAALCQQGNHNKATSDSLRISMFTILLTALFLFYPYSANITSLLQTPGGSIRTLHDIMTSNMKILVHDMPFNRYMLEDSNKSTIRKEYRQKIFTDQRDICGVFVSSERGMEKARSGHYGFQADVLLGYTEVERKWDEKEKCLMAEVKFLVVPRIAFAVPQHSGYKEIIRRFLRRECEVGILSYSRQRYLQPKPKCSNLASSAYKTIGLDEFWPALIILLYGMVVSLLVFAVEIFYYSSTNAGRTIFKGLKYKIVIMIYLNLRRKLEIKRRQENNAIQSRQQSIFNLKV